MPIPIIENFQLGTNLPLDARYVVNNIYDTSLYWHDGMQIYNSSDGRLYIVTNSSLEILEDVLYRAEFDASYGSVDSSLNSLYNFVSDLSTYTDTIIPYVDGSLIIRDESINVLFLENDTQDASIIVLRAEDVRQDGSLNALFLENDIQDSSIIALRAEDVRQDGSLNLLFLENDIQDASIIRIDASIVQLNDWSAQLDASIQRIDASLVDYVRKDGDTMTGPLFIDSSLRVSGNTTLDSNVDIKGNLRVDGSTTFLHTDILDVSTGWIYLNTGLTGIPPSWLQSGIVVQRGDASAFGFIYDETRQEFRIGILGLADASGVYNDADTQAVATREDIPVDWAIPIWNPDLWRFDTSTSLVLDVSTLITEYDVSVNAKITTEEFNVSGNTAFPSNPEDGDMYYYRPLHSPFWYDASRGKWLGKQKAYGSGKPSANRNSDVYMDVGGGSMTLTDGIYLTHNGVITAVSVSVDTIITAASGRTMQFRVNDSLTYNVQLTIPQGSSKAYSDFENLDASAGDLIQAVLIANGTDNVGNIISTFEITERP